MGKRASPSVVPAVGESPVLPGAWRSCELPKGWPWVFLRVSTLALDACRGETNRLNSSSGKSALSAGKHLKAVFSNWINL